MPTFYLAAPEGPLTVRHGGRDVECALYPHEVTTWATANGARKARERAVQGFAPGITLTAIEVVAVVDDDAIRRHCVEADEKRSAGMREAAALRVELASARASASLAPYTLEQSDGTVVEITKDAARDRLNRAIVAVTNAPPEVKRWL